VQLLLYGGLNKGAAVTAADHGTCYCSTGCRQANGIRQKQPCFLFCSSLSQILDLKSLRGFVVFRSF